MQKLMFTPVNVSNYFWTQRTDTPCLVPSSFYDEKTLESLPGFLVCPVILKKTLLMVKTQYLCGVQDILDILVIMKKAR